jgi:hypothetical protein
MDPLAGGAFSDPNFTTGFAFPQRPAIGLFLPAASRRARACLLV